MAALAEATAYRQDARPPMPRPPPDRRGPAARSTGACGAARTDRRPEGSGAWPPGGARWSRAPLLDIAHLELEALAGRNENGAVTDPVLVSAEHLLAPIHQQRKLGRILDDGADSPPRPIPVP